MKLSLEPRPQITQELITGFDDISEMVGLYSQDNKTLAKEYGEYLNSNFIKKENIELAVLHAMKYHQGQYRKNGENEIVHELMSGYSAHTFLADSSLHKKSKEEIFYATLFHDTVENYKGNSKELLNETIKFGAYPTAISLALSGKEPSEIADYMNELDIPIIEFNNEVLHIKDFLDVLPGIELVKIFENIPNLYTKDALGKRKEGFVNDTREDILPLAKKMDEKGILHENMYETLEYFMNR